VRIRRRRGDTGAQRPILPPLTMRWRLSVRSMQPVSRPLAAKPAGSLRPVATRLTARPAGSLRIVHAHRYRAGISVRAFRARSATGAPIASMPTTERIQRRLRRVARPSERMTASPPEAVPASVISTRLAVTVLSLRRDQIFGNAMHSGPARRSAVRPSATELRQIIERSYHWSERVVAARPSPFPIAGVMRGRPSSSDRRQASPRPNASFPNRSASIFQEALRARSDIRQGLVPAVSSWSLGG
jgi:hypothetical protein